MSGDRGSAAVELVVLVPVLVLLMGFVILVGRLATVQQDVTSASRDAARAASARGPGGDPVGEATRVATQTLAGRNVTCASLGVDVDVSQLTPGGQVSVTVRCDVGYSDLLGLGMGASTRSVAATSVAVVDTYITDTEEPE